VSRPAEPDQLGEHQPRPSRAGSAAGSVVELRVVAARATSCWPVERGQAAPRARAGRTARQQRAERLRTPVSRGRRWRPDLRVEPAARSDQEHQGTEHQPADQRHGAAGSEGPRPPPGRGAAGPRRSPTRWGLLPRYPGRPAAAAPPDSVQQFQGAGRAGRHTAELACADQRLHAISRSDRTRRLHRLSRSTTELRSRPPRTSRPAAPGEPLSSTYPSITRLTPEPFDFLTTTGLDVPVRSMLTSGTTTSFRQAFHS